MKALVRGELKITDAIQQLLQDGHTVRAHTFESWWLDAGTIEDLLNANRLILHESAGRELHGRFDDESILDGCVMLGEGAQVRRSQIIGPVSIGAGTLIEDSFIGCHVSIGRECTSITLVLIPFNLYKHHKYIWKNAWNDLKYRHSGTGIGVFWNFINPIIEIAIYAGVFTLLLSTEGWSSSYVLYLSAGMLGWRSFSSTILHGSNAFIQHATHLKRLGFPPEIFVAKITLSSTFILFIYLAILLPTSWLLGNQLGWEVVFLPLLAVLLQGFAFGIALVLAHLRAFFLDLGQVLPILLYAWRWSMPIIYTDARISEDIQWWLRLNPPYVFIQSIRDVILFHKVPSFDQWSFMVGLLLVSLFIGSLVLQKLQYEVREVI